MKGTFAILASFVLAPLASGLDLVPLGSTWDYMHPRDGVDPAEADPDFDTTWFLNGPGFNTNYDGPAFGADPKIDGPPVESGSGPAPLGYGGVTYIDTVLGGLATVLLEPDPSLRGTAYFRHEFTVDSDVPNLALEIIADDAAVVYLNGVEFLRTNFTGPDTYAAGSTLSAAEAAPDVFIGRLGELEAGTYTIAVSLHQLSNTSSDLGFDLRLSDEGFADPPVGFYESFLNPTPTPFFILGDLNGWISTGNSMLSLNSGGGVEIRSETVDLRDFSQSVFSMEIFAQELSGGSNFEANDSFSARLEVEDADGGISNISLVPGGWDFDGNGALNGEDFGPGLAVTLGVTLSVIKAVRVPDGTVAATLVVDAVNDSLSETFRFGNALFTEPALTPPFLGQIDVGAGPVEIFVVHSGAWDEAQPVVHSLNNANAVETMISDPIDVSAASGLEVSFTLTASETSVGSNFEPGDAFQAWLEVVDANGLGRIVRMEFGAADLDANGFLSGDEIAPGVDAAVSVSESFRFVAALPNGVAMATLVALGVNDSTSETFSISNFQVALPPDPLPSFAITAVTEAGGEVEVTWESEIDVIYELQFSADLTNGSFFSVETLVATDVTTTSSHVPAGPEGFYRVIRRQ